MAGVVGVPYHRIGAVVPRRWWRLAVPVVVFVLAQVVMAAGVGLGSLLPERGVPVLGRHTQLAVLFASIGLSLPLLALWMARTRRPFGTVSSVAGRLRVRWLAACVLVAVTPYTALGVAMIVLGAGWVGWDTFAFTMVGLLPLLVVAVLAEEYVSRGFVLQSVGSLFASWWPAVMVQAALFAVLTIGVGATVWGILDVFAYAAMLGWLTVRTGGLEAAIAMHLAQNLMAAIVDVATLPANITQAATDQTIADAPWLPVLAHVVLTGVFVIWLERIAVWSAITRTTTVTGSATGGASRDGDGMAGPVVA